MYYLRVNYSFRLIHSLETLIFEDEMQVTKIDYCIVCDTLVIVVVVVVTVLEGNQDYSLTLVLVVNCISCE